MESHWPQKAQKAPAQKGKSSRVEEKGIGTKAAARAPDEIHGLCELQQQAVDGDNVPNREAASAEAARGKQHRAEKPAAKDGSLPRVQERRKLRGAHRRRRDPPQEAVEARELRRFRAHLPTPAGLEQQATRPEHKDLKPR